MAAVKARPTDLSMHILPQASWHTSVVDCMTEYNQACSPQHRVVTFWQAGAVVALEAVLAAAASSFVGGLTRQTKARRS
jgi:hypothetical protein